MASHSIDELFSKYPNKELTIISVTDFYIKKDPYYYKVIFKFTEKNGSVYYPVAEIPPEDLHKRYKVGSTFFNGKQIGYGENVEFKEFQIDNRFSLHMQKIKSVYSINDKSIISHSNINQFLLEQNCYFFSNPNYDLIIPHYTIANHFHFVSSSMKHAILDNTFAYLYKQHSFNRIDNNTVSLEIKSANLSDLKIICNFLIDSNSFDSFKYYIHQRAVAKDMVQIQSIFPYKSIFNIKTTCINISNTLKPKYLVLGIYQNDYKFSFTDVHYILDDPSDVNKIEIGGMNPLKTPSNNTGITHNIPPSSRYTTFHNTFIDTEFYDTFVVNLTPIFNGEKVRINKTNNIDKTVNGSFEKPNSNGKENVQKKSVSTSTINPTKTKDIFNLNDFYRLYNSLNKHKDVSSQFISNISSLNAKRDDKNNYPKKYFTDEHISRKHIYGNFKYKKSVNVGFIEIEHSNNWKSISTWFFIFKEDSNFLIDSSFIDSIIFQYIGSSLTLKDIENELAQNNIIFFRKTHPSDMEEKNIFDWIKRLLTVIESNI